MDHIEKAIATNPDRLPKPDRDHTLYAGKFYFANDKGTYGVSTQSFRLAFCEQYIWTDEGFSIPLANIIETGLSKKGGFITYYDNLSRDVAKFNFTKLGFIGFRRSEVEKLLELVNRYLPDQRPTRVTTVDSSGFDTITPNTNSVQLNAPESGIRCEQCDADDVSVLIFKEFRFIGIAPLAYSYSLTPKRFLLCKAHAQKQAIECAHRIALFGYLGFPGFVAAPWYICRNLWELRRANAADSSIVMRTVITSIVLPLLLLTAAIAAIWYFSPPI